MNDIGKSIFNRYIGIDYSGAETPTSSLNGLRVYLADYESLPEEIPPPSSPRKYWTRRGITEWLDKRLKEDERIVVPIFQIAWPVHTDVSSFAATGQSCLSGLQ